ncbi:hypothetical protein TI04_06835 [Achromatium sp. WMS2]|nr:hypothetical protein TI04_06835 [Achromatium sp. WMS2]
MCQQLNLVPKYQLWWRGLMFSLLLFSWSPMTVAKWYGLVIGINEYQYGDYTKDPRPLKGAVDDAYLIRDTLRSLGVIVPDTQVLINAQATREGFIQAWVKLQQQMHAEDTLWLSFSGHGGQETDRGVKDEADDLDETLWFYDFNPDQPLLGRISDDELAGLLEASKARDTLLVVDSCHSGGMSRCTAASADCPSFRGGRRYRITNDAVPPPSILPTVADNDLSMVRVTHIVAADKEQLDIQEVAMPDGKYHGALSWYWSQGLRGAADANQDGLVSRAELGEFLDNNVPKKIKSQRPKIEPKADSKVLTPSIPMVRILWTGAPQAEFAAWSTVNIVNQGAADLTLSLVGNKYQLRAGTEILAQAAAVKNVHPAIQRWSLQHYLQQRSGSLGQLDLRIVNSAGPYAPSQAVQFVVKNGDSKYRALYLFDIAENGVVQRFFPLAKYQDPVQIDRYPYSFPPIQPSMPFGYDLAIALGCQQPSVLLDRLLQQYATTPGVPTITEFYDILSQTPCQIGWQYWHTVP